MQFLDLILALVLVYGLIRGLWNGFLVELASTASLLLGIFIAIKFSGFATKIISDSFQWNPTTIRLTAFVLTFIIAVVGIILLAKVFTKAFSAVGLGIFNKLLGAGFGLLKMALILSVVLNVFFKLNSKASVVEDKDLESSILYHPILKLAPLLFPSISEFTSEFKSDYLSTLTDSAVIQPSLPSGSITRFQPSSSSMT